MLLPSANFPTITDRLPCRAGRYFPGLYSPTAHAARHGGGLPFYKFGSSGICIVAYSLFLSRVPRESGQGELL